MTVPRLSSWPDHVDYLMFVDESGTRDMSKIDPCWPILSLAGVIVSKEVYFTKIQNVFLDLKKTVWPPDGTFEFAPGEMRRICFHCRDMRMHSGPFKDLTREQVNLLDGSFPQALRDADFLTIAAIVDKNRVQRRYGARDPYDDASAFLLERFCYFLYERYHRERKGRGAIVFENRTPEDDKALFSFLKRCRTHGTKRALGLSCGTNDGELIGRHIHSFGWHPKWDGNGNVVSGLEIADHVAWHMGAWHLKQTGARNKLGMNHDILWSKLRRRPNGNPQGYGYTVFPSK